MVLIEHGFAEAHRRQAAQLYWEAFSRKLEPALGPAERGIGLLERTLVCERALVAVDGGELLGLAGFQLDGSSLVGLRARDLWREFGLFRGSWRSLLLALLHRKPRAGELLMDGIVVQRDRRGHGIGTSLLNAVIALARERGLERVRLDVVDTNPAARRLYERIGFVAARTEHTPYLRRLFGFGASTEMVLIVSGSRKESAEERATSAPENRDGRRDGD